MATGSWAKGRLDWADAVVPLAASICFVAIVGGGIGYALSVAVPFIAARQVIWAVNRRQPDPRPRQPLVAAIAGILIWGFIIFRK